MGYTRRSLLLASVGTIAVAGCLDGAADDPANGEEMEPDDAGRATVAVGADGAFRFDPETLEIAPGTAVQFV